MKPVAKKIKVFVSITPVSDHQIGVKIGYSILNFKEEGSSMLSCYIPAFDISYSASDLESASRKGAILIKSLTDHFFLHTNDGLKGIVLELHKLGFKAHDDMLTVKQLINHKIVKAKFQPTREYSGSEFSSADKVDHELDMQLAVA